MKTLKRRSVWCLTLLATALCIVTCADPMQGLKAEVEAIADKMEEKLNIAENSVKEVLELLETTLNDPNLENVDISKMDEKNGGDFYTFTSQGKSMYVNRYYPETVNDNIVAVIAGVNEITDLDKKQCYALYLKKSEFIKIGKQKYCNYLYSNILPDIKWGFPYTIRKIPNSKNSSGWTTRNNPWTKSNWGRHDQT